MLNPAENRKIWMKAAEDSRELLEGRVKNDIEKYRKGYCKLRLTDTEGRPIKNAKIKVNPIPDAAGHGLYRSPAYARYGTRAAGSC